MTNGFSTFAHLEKFMDKQFNLIAVVEAVQKRFLPIAIISALVLVGAFVVTTPSLKILPLKYESHTVVFPANLSMSDRPYLFDASTAVDVQLEQFGDKHDVDRLVSVAISGQVLSHLVNKFNLIDHYEINKEKVRYPFTAAISKLKSNYRAYKNEYGGVEVWVTDKDKDMAAAIANEAVVVSDRINRDMLLEGRTRMMNILEKHLVTKQKDADDLSAQLATATPEQMKVLEVKQILALEQLSKYSNMLDQYRLTTAQDISTLHVMEKAYPAEKESSGRLMLIIAAFLVALFTLILGATVVHVMSK